MVNRDELCLAHLCIGLVHQVVDDEHVVVGVVFVAIESGVEVVAVVVAVAMVVD